MTSFSYHDDLKWHLSLLFRLPFCPFLDFSFVKEIFNSQTSTWSKISKNHDSQVFADLANQMIPRFIVFVLDIKCGSFGAVEITAVHLFGDLWGSWVNVDLRCFDNFFSWRWATVKSRSSAWNLIWSWKNFLKKERLCFIRD